MGDIFKEQIVKRKSSMKQNAMRVGLVLAVVVVFFAGFIFIGEFGIYITVAAAFGAYVLMGMLNVEYEYVFTNGELDIDIIYNKLRRKRIFSGHLNDFEVMAHVSDKNHAGDFSRSAETKDFSSGNPEGQYAFLTNIKGKPTKVLIEPNEVMLKAFSTVLTPRKLFIKK